MDFTGERYIPSLAGQIKYEHFHRYALCLDFVAGKAVLDIASGEGYGSALLARVAQSVVGVDIDSECIGYAKQKYNNNPTLNFLVGSCESIPLDNESVEIVTSFETIEHHDKHEKMMIEIKRVLKPGGLLIISSPDRLNYSDKQNYSNPFHVKELYYDELVSLLNRYFKYVQVYGQRLATGSFVFPLQSSNETSLKAFTNSGTHVTQKVCSLESPIYFVAICSDEAINMQQSINSIYIDSSDDLLAALENRFYETRVVLKQLQSQLHATQAELQRLQLQSQKNQQIQLEGAAHTKIKAIPQVSVNEHLNFPIIEPISNEIDRPLWSVMIPTYKGTQYLEQTLRSVLEQDPGSNLMQIEVVDDCSTQDDPEELVREIGQGRVSFYRQPKNLGLIGNWNDCIKRARGHWVHILHQDDVVKFGFYKRLQAAVEKEPTIGAAFCRYFYMERGCEQALSPLERETPGIISNWIERIAVMQRIECPSIIVKREVYEELGGYCQEAYYAADWEMWKRIAAHYSVWYEPELLACYRLHLSSESSRLVKSGKNIADTRKAIEISHSYLPITIANELSNQARENCAFKALNIARRMLSGGEIDGAIAQMREGIKSSQSSNIISSVLELVQELSRNSNQHNIFPINALDQFLSAFQEPFQKQQETALIESLKLKDINLIIFPDWEQSEELLYQDLASVITSLVNHPNKNQITLLIHTGNLSEDEASLFLSDIVMNLLMPENLDITDEPEISLVGQLSVREWETLLPRIQARIILQNENKEIISQANAYSCKSVQVGNIPVFEINAVVN